MQKLAKLQALRFSCMHLSALFSCLSDCWGGLGCLIRKIGCHVGATTATLASASRYLVHMALRASRRDGRSGIVTRAGTLSMHGHGLQCTHDSSASCTGTWKGVSADHRKNTIGKINSAHSRPLRTTSDMQTSLCSARLLKRTLLRHDQYPHVATCCRPSMYVRHDVSVRALNRLSSRLSRKQLTRAVALARLDCAATWDVCSKERCHSTKWGPFSRSWLGPYGYRT